MPIQQFFVDYLTIITRIVSILCFFYVLSEIPDFIKGNKRRERAVKIILAVFVTVLIISALKFAVESF